jgi:hypothetical protein
MNIAKSSAQRVYESVLKAVRKNTNCYGVDLPDPTDVRKGKKRALVEAINAAEGAAYEAARTASVDGDNSVDDGDRLTAYNANMEQQLQTLAAAHGLTYKAPGASLRT